jgi:YesN/AraC family two-component response regulator
MLTLRSLVKGVQGCRLAQQLQPDVVLMDVE